MNLRKRKGVKGWFYGLCLLLAFFTLAGCGEKPAEKDANIQSQSPAAEKTKERIYRIGETGRTAKLEM